MNSAGKLSDYDHPSIQAIANQISEGKTTVLEKVKGAFDFVRDEIKFGFPPKWDAVKASETIQYGLGYCNTKATLFRALCRVINVPARIHAGLIDLKIMTGIFPSVVIPFLPRVGDHSWLEIEIEGEWKPLDSYINDKPFYQRALQRLERSGKATGYSISRAKGDSSCEFNFGEMGFVHMGAVVEDRGVWDDFSEYMSSGKYAGMNRMLLMAYPMMARICNRNIKRIRNGS
jgi:hypothetical protein